MNKRIDVSKSENNFIRSKYFIRALAVVIPVCLATSCMPVDIPGGRTPTIPTVNPADGRFEGLNEKRDPVTRVKLGRDVLMPQPLKEDMLPDVTVGPYELRGETLASALQLILDDYDISLAFESDEGLTRRITIANLRGKVKNVVNQVCSLANMYCHFENGTLTIKDKETFVVDLPPISAQATSSSSTSSSAPGGGGSSASTSSDSSTAYEQIAVGLEAVIGSKPIIDKSTRVLIYTATQRSNKYALQYFERLRKNTALIIFETHIWEVELNNENRMGINWTAFAKPYGGNFGLNFSMPGGAPVGTSSPIKFTYTGFNNTKAPDSVLDFIAEHGTVRTISQPQITVLSGSSATLSVAQDEKYISGLTRTPSTTVGIADTISTTLDTVHTGLTMNVTSAWDQSTVYGNLNITLDELIQLVESTIDANTFKLPKTSKRSLQTAIRVRPGDAILIGGIVSEKDNFTESGPGFKTPLFSTARQGTAKNTELVFMLRPRVVSFVMGDDTDTPAVVDAPKDEPAQSAQLEDMTGRVQEMFGQGMTPEMTAPEPVTEIRNGIEKEDLNPLPPSIPASSLAPVEPIELKRSSDTAGTPSSNVSYPPSTKKDKGAK